MKQQRIVCAAILFTFEFLESSEDTIVTGVRHYDKLMRGQIDVIDEYYWSRKVSEVQGFVDNKGNFLDREQAFLVAQDASQIIHICGNPSSKELFSENLY